MHSAGEYATVNGLIVCRLNWKILHASSKDDLHYRHCLGTVFLAVTEIKTVFKHVAFIEINQFNVFFKFGFCSSPRV